MTLLARRRRIDLQNRVDESHRRLQFRHRLVNALPFFRHGVSQRFPHHAPMDRELPRYSFYCSQSELIFPLLLGAGSDRRSGPIQSIEITGASE